MWPGRRALPLSFAALLSAGLAFAPRARAQGSRADAFFQEGVKLLEAGRTHEACVLFEQSLRLDPAPGTLQNLAICHEEEGRTATAHAEFEELARQAAADGQKAREALGRQRAAALARRLSQVEFRFAADANVAEIGVDDARLDRAAWKTPLALDPGPHTLTFGAPGKRAVARSITVSSAPGTTPVDVPQLEDAGTPPVPLRTLGLVVGGAGIAGIALGSVFGGLTFSKKAESDAHCMGKFCDDQGVAAMSTAYRYATASTALFVLGLAATGTGTFLFVWGGRPPSAGLRVSPQVSASAAGLRFDGAF
jgi:hypothetical protein